MCRNGQLGRPHRFQYTSHTLMLTMEDVIHADGPELFEQSSRMVTVRQENANQGIKFSENPGVVRHDSACQRNSGQRPEFRIRLTKNTKPACLDHFAEYRQWNTPLICAQSGPRLSPIAHRSHRLADE